MTVGQVVAENLAAAEAALTAGDADGAETALAQAAAQAGDAPVPVRAAVGCLRARLANLRGEPAEAAAVAEQVLALAPPVEARVAAISELADALVAQGQPDAAVAVIGEALADPEVARDDGARLQGRRGRAHLAAGRAEAAHRDLRAAYQALRDEGEPEGALGAVQEALAAGLTVADDWVDLHEAALALARSLGDGGARGRLVLLAADRALAQGASIEALRLANEARTLARQAVDPTGYVGGTATAALAAEHEGNHAVAYEILATAYVTIGDLLGPDAAQATVGELLKAARDRWGTERFSEVRTDYEAARRARIRS